MQPTSAATAEHRFEQDTIVYSLLPHMHLRGKAFRFEAVYPDGRREVLLDVPRYEFEWQNVYVLAEPKLMPEGSVLRCLARYDNSADNLSNPDPNGDRHAGASKPSDEMLVGYVEAVAEVVYAESSRTSLPARALRALYMLGLVAREVPGSAGDGYTGEAGIVATRPVSRLGGLLELTELIIDAITELLSSESRYAKFGMPVRSR